VAAPLAVSVNRRATVDALLVTTALIERGRADGAEPRDRRRAKVRVVLALYAFGGSFSCT
jgi:hypothetical protein